MSFLPLCYCLNGLLRGSWTAGARFQQVSPVECLVIMISVQLFRKTVLLKSMPTRSASQCVPHKTTVVLASDASLLPHTVVNYRRLTAEFAAFIRIRSFILARKSVTLPGAIVSHKDKQMFADCTLAGLIKLLAATAREGTLSQSRVFWDMRADWELKPKLRWRHIKVIAQVSFQRCCSPVPLA